jgi:hypothetical protein
MPHRPDLVLYKYLSPERIDALEKRQLAFSHVDEFNDPFELLPHVGPTPRRMASRTLKEILAFNERRRILREQGIKAVTELKGRWVILSLTEVIDDPLMWGYYARGHSGFAIGFHPTDESLIRSTDGTLRRLAEMRYSTHRPSTEQVDTDQIDEFLLTKSVDWKHEKEWRLFELSTNTNDAHRIGDRKCWNLSFAPSAVHSVVVGCRATVETVRRLDAALDHPDFKGPLGNRPPLRRVTIDEERFSLNVP